jgi:hypothetical protein
VGRGGSPGGAVGGGELGDGGGCGEADGALALVAVVAEGGIVATNGLGLGVGSLSLLTGA